MKALKVVGSLLTLGVVVVNDVSAAAEEASNNGLG